MSNVVDFPPLPDGAPDFENTWRARIMTDQPKDGLRAGDIIVASSEPGWRDDGLYALRFDCGSVIAGRVVVRTKRGRLRKKPVLGRLICPPDWSESRIYRVVGVYTSQANVINLRELERKSS